MEQQVAAFIVYCACKREQSKSDTLCCREDSRLRSENNDSSLGDRMMSIARTHIGPSPHPYSH